MLVAVKNAIFCLFGRFLNTHCIKITENESAKPSYCVEFLIHNVLIR